ncbi:hypothetical protein V5O48_006937 [Marasmius crinis-equi]|uniref:DNA mismatch repair proteins mutS family domain-containing protein n=1 Tax=Marasmius crinis-equi TaxID=585013 RepID=A0ABR3FIJ6_9AGAR
MVKQTVNIFRSFTPARLQQYRFIHATNPHFFDASSTRRVKGVKTKKAYEELPRYRLNSDGTIAAPLEKWWGGEHGSEGPPHNTSYSGAARSRANDKPDVVKTRQGAPESDTVDIGNGEIQAPVEETLNVTKPKRRRKSKTEVETEPTCGEEAPAKKRGRKPKAKKEMAEEPAVIEDEFEEQGNGRQQGTLAKEILENHAKFPHCILFTRVGQFYESYFDQAVEVASLLNIKLARRRWAGKTVAMCGFPLPHLDKYLKILVQQNKRFVAMCEEFPRFLGTGKREFERRVVRVVTPGTLIDESFLNHYENNFLLAISAPPPSGTSAEAQSAGIAWIDVSTGEFYSKVAPIENLRDELARIGPREVLLEGRYQKDANSAILSAVAEIDTITSYVDLTGRTPPKLGTLQPTPTAVTDELVAEYSNTSEIPDVYTAEEGGAITLLTAYLQANLLEHMPPLLQPSREHMEGRMQIDSHTIQALEIRETMRDGSSKGSLMSVIKRTITSSGTRLLSRWLCSPSTSIKEINARQSLVAFFCDRPHFRSDLRVLLSRAEDAGRIVQKFLLGRGDPSDLLSLSAGIKTWGSIVERVRLERRMEAREQANFNRSQEWSSLDSLLSRMADLEQLASRIGSAILQSEGQPVVRTTGEPEDGFPSDLESPVLSFNRHDWRYGRSRFGININPQFSEDLQNAHTRLQTLLDKKDRLEEQLQLNYDAPSLTLRSSPAQGMHIHLAKSKRDQAKLNADPAFVSISETGTTKAYFNQEWSQLGSEIFNVALALSATEKEAFETLRQEITSHAPSLRRNARILDELDVTLAFATLATEMNFVRPNLLDDTTYHVVNGRHPTVEMGLLTSGKVFTPNTVHLEPSSHLHVITGPNMAGKSTFLRQTALVAILAQTGSFVPADHATLGIVDKLFSRVGAKDDLFHDRSTFMVEMLETAEILRRATPKSLVIMDEVGRGTTVNDGLAIAFASVHHMVAVNQCRTLFATHFHELSDMLGCTTTHRGQGQFANVSFYCTDVDELEEGFFTYSYRLRPGVNRDSHGLKVAQLAGMPEAAISVARNVLNALREQKAQRYDAEQLASLGQSASPRTDQQSS